MKKGVIGVLVLSFLLINHEYWARADTFIDDGSKVRIIEIIDG